MITSIMTVTLFHRSSYWSRVMDLDSISGKQFKEEKRLNKGNNHSLR